MKELANKGYDFPEHFLRQWTDEEVRGYNLTADKIINVLQNGSHIFRDGDEYYTKVGKVGRQALSVMYDTAGTLHTLFNRGLPQGPFEYIVRPDFPFDL